MQHLPKLLRNSLTWDQGAELALHKRIGASLDMAVYFCDPHSRGSAAPTRTPTGSCASTSPKAPTYPSTRRDYLDAVAEELNDRPRKTLGFMKPSEKIIRTARRRVITSTTDNVTMEGRSNLRCCNHH